MTRKQTAVAIVSGLLLLALAACTLASTRIYRTLLPQVDTAPIERRAVYLTWECEGTILQTSAGRRIVCSATWEVAAKLPEESRGQIVYDGTEHTAVVTEIAQEGEAATITMTVPYPLRDLADGTTLPVSLHLEGGVYDYVVPASCIQEGSKGPYLLTVREVDGVAGPELRVDEFLLDGILYTNGEYTAFSTIYVSDLPEEVVSWSSEPIFSGSAATWRETQ